MNTGPDSIDGRDDPLFVDEGLYRRPGNFSRNVIAPGVGGIALLAGAEVARRTGLPEISLVGISVAAAALLVRTNTFTGEPR